MKEGTERGLHVTQGVADPAEEPAAPALPWGRAVQQEGRPGWACEGDHGPCGGPALGPCPRSDSRVLVALGEYVPWPVAALRVSLADLLKTRYKNHSVSDADQEHKVQLPSEPSPALIPGGPTAPPPPAPGPQCQQQVPTTPLLVLSPSTAPAPREPRPIAPPPWRRLPSLGAPHQPVTPPRPPLPWTSLQGHPYCLRPL